MEKKNGSFEGTSPIEVCQIYGELGGHQFLDWIHYIVYGGLEGASKLLSTLPDGSGTVAMEVISIAKSYRRKNKKLMGKYPIVHHKGYTIYPGFKQGVEIHQYSSEKQKWTFDLYLYDKLQKCQFRVYHHK